jgi:hypothetical protein
MARRPKRSFPGCSRGARCDERRRRRPDRARPRRARPAPTSRSSASAPRSAGSSRPMTTSGTTARSRC